MSGFIFSWTYQRYHRIVCTSSDRPRHARRIGENDAQWPITERNVMQKPYWRKKRYSVNNESDCDGNVRYLLHDHWPAQLATAPLPKHFLANFSVYPNRIFYSLTAHFFDQPKMILITRKKFYCFSSQLHTRIPWCGLCTVGGTLHSISLWYLAAYRTQYTESRLYNFKGGDRFLVVCSMQFSSIWKSTVMLIFCILCTLSIWSSLIYEVINN
jgi:hypothetical protein